MNLISRFIAALLLAFALAGCGQSGPLYIAGDPSSVKETPAEAESKEETEEDREEDED